MPRSSDRAVSIQVNYVVALGVTTTLVVGLVMTTGTFVDTQTDRAARHELEAIGNRLATQIRMADRLAARGGAVTMHVSQPRKVAGGAYTVELRTGSRCDTPRIDAETCLVLEAGGPGVTVVAPVANVTDVAIAAAGPGRFRISATPSGAGAPAGGGAGLDVGIDVGIGREVSATGSSGQNLTLANNQPVARFTFEPGAPTNDSVIHFESDSADPDGTVTKHEWDLDGDGTVDQTGASFDYSYVAPGKYNATLTVTDDNGVTDSTTKLIVVGGLVYERDATAVDFDGDGNSERGGVRFNATNHHAGQATLVDVMVDPDDDSIDGLDPDDGSGTSSSRGDAAMYFETSSGSSYVDKAGGFAVPDGGLIVDISADGDANGGDLAIGSGAGVDVAFSEFWDGSTNENMTGKPVTVALHYTFNGELFVSKFTLFEAVNQPPDPAFVYTCNGTDCTFNGSVSSDPDGSIANYTWNFDDGTTGTGETVNHTYAANGSYQVTLTVTDDNATSSSVAELVPVGGPSLDAKVNFQPEGAEAPTGYLVDSGETYGDRGNGFEYGWDNPTKETRDRGATADQRFDTLTHMDSAKYAGGGDRTWELNVSDHRYRVYVAMGDPAYQNQTDNVTIETTAIDDPDPEDPSYEDHWDQYTATPAVTDGRLTIAPAGGADNAKIAFVHVTAVDTRPYQESGGEVVMEAERFMNVRQGNDNDTGPGAAQDMHGWAWAPFEDTAASGRALDAVPNRSANAEDTKNGPRLDYEANVTTTGTYYVWVRMKCPSDSDNSVHVGLDGTVATFGDLGLTYGCASSDGWAWVNRDASADPVTIDVSSPGVYTFNVWMREDGTMIDKIVLTTNSSFDPTDSGPKGPPESPKG